MFIFNSNKHSFSHRIFLFSILFITSFHSGYAQVSPYFSMYQLNNFLINPAITGIENYADVKVGSRRQWTGIQGAPVTQYVTFHTPIGKEDTRITPTSFFVKGENPYGIPSLEDRAPGDKHHGVGLVVINDKAGFLNRWSASATYAYHVPVSGFSMLSAGFSAGVSGSSVDRSKIEFAGLDPDDPAVGFSYDELNKKRFEVGAGLWFYTPEFYAGISAMNLSPSKNKFGQTKGTSFAPNYFASIGGRMMFSEFISLLPSVVFQYSSPDLKSVNVTGKLQYKDLIWLGGNYRYSSLVGGYSGMAGLNIANAFNISYSYEISNTSQLQQFSGSTHEIMLGLIFGNNYENVFNRNRYK